MKIAVATAAVLLGAAGMASAQDGRKMDELQREFDRAMKGLHEKFEGEKARMEKEFRAARERLFQQEKPKQPPKGEPAPFEKKMDTQELLQRILERLDRLEKRLDREMPRFDFKDLPFKNMPRDFKDMPFDFRKFEKEFEGFREFAPRWREFVPKFKDDEEGEEKKPEKKKTEKKEEKKKF